MFEKKAGPPTGGQLGHFALGPTMLGAPRARQGASFSDFTKLTIIKDRYLINCEAVSNVQ